MSLFLEHVSESKDCIRHRQGLESHVGVGIACKDLSLCDFRFIPKIASTQTGSRVTGTACKDLCVLSNSLGSSKEFYITNFTLISIKEFAYESRKKTILEKNYAIICNPMKQNSQINSTHQQALRNKCSVHFKGMGDVDQSVAVGTDSQDPVFQ